MLGSQRACSSAHLNASWRHHIAKKFGSILLALVLVASLTPCVAWADENANRSTVNVEELPAACTGSSADDAAMLSPSSQTQSSVTESTPAEKNEGSNANDSSSENVPSVGDANGAGNTQTQGNESVIVSNEAVTDDDSADQSVEAIDAQAGQPNALATRASSAFEEQASVALTTDCFASISTSSNSSSATAASGFQYVGTTLYASAWQSRTKKVVDDGTWTYTWYVSDTRSPSSLSGAVQVGTQGSSIILTDAMVGKYLFVEIAASDGVAVSGPRQASRPTGKLYGVGQIKAAIPDKTALDEYSFALIQDSITETAPSASISAASLHVGQVLNANAYDSEASPNRRIAAQVGWTYQWLAGESQGGADSSYQPISGQTSQTLTLTNELAKQLAGKYIRVKIVGDGQELFGPSGTFDTPASTSYNTPGPVVAADQIVVSHVILAYNEADFDSSDESVPHANVGDVIKAAAYDKDSPSTLYGADKVTFSWQVADSADGTYSEVATGESYTVGEYAGKYLKVVATAKNGVPGFDTHETEPGRILVKGVKTLYSVSILNTSKAAMDTGTTLQAMAYEGDYWNPTAVAEGVTYTWRWADEDPSSYAFDSDAGWHVIDAVTSDSFTVPEGFEGRWISVQAYAGDNVVATEDYDAAGPFKKPGTVELYTVGMEKRVGDTTDRFVYRAGETIGVTARATSSTGTAGDTLTDEQITCTWKISDSRTGEYQDLTDENVHKTAFVIPETYVGKYLKCEVFAGFNTESVSMSQAVAEALEVEAPAYDLSSVGVESSGQLVQVGNTLTPAPMYMVQSGTWSYESALPVDVNVTYTWYAADDATGTNTRKLDSANATTGALVLSASEESLYVYVEANAGSNTMRSQAYLVESAAAQNLTISAQVVGTTRHQSGEDYSAEAWVPLTEYTWSSDTKTTAWDVFAKMLDKAGYFYSLDGGVPYSITTPDKAYTLAMSAAAPWSYWSFYVNGEYASVAANNYVLQDGDTIELKYYDAAGAEQLPDIAVDPNVALPDWMADWSGYGNADGSGTAITNAETPTENAELSWTFDYSAYGEYGMTSASEPVIVNGFVYMAVNKTMLKIDASTGKVLQETPLAASISYTSRPLYAQGLIVVPLDGGCVQALAADTLTTKWLTSAVSSVAQSSSTLTVRDGRVYVGTIDVTTDENYNSMYSNGTFTCFNLLTGALVWRHTNADEGYYWTGGTLSGEFVIVPTSAGTVEVLDAGTGEVKSSLSTGSLVNSDCVLSQDGSHVYLVSADGKLHTYTVDESGKISEKDTALSLGLETSKCTPTVVGSTLIVGGAVEGDCGALAVVDLETHAVRLITTANGTALPAGWGSASGVKAVPLVSDQNSQVYVYFTTNGAEGDWPDYTTGGGVYLYRLGDAEATLLYDADGYHNYCDSPVIADAQGCLYYLNDSNHLIVLKNGTSITPVAPGGQTNPSDTNDNKQSNTTTSNDKNTTTQNTLANTQTIPATHTPLANAENSAANDGEAGVDGAAKDDEADTSTKTAAQASAQARGVTSADANSVANGDAEDTNAPVMNVWAVGGLVVGVAGLVCVGIYLARTRRQSEDDV